MKAPSTLTKRLSRSLATSTPAAVVLYFTLNACFAGTVYFGSGGFIHVNAVKIVSTFVSFLIGSAVMLGVWLFLRRITIVKKAKSRYWSWRRRFWYVDIAWVSTGLFSSTVATLFAGGRASSGFLAHVDMGPFAFLKLPFAPITGLLLLVWTLLFVAIISLARGRVRKIAVSAPVMV